MPSKKNTIISNALPTLEHYKQLCQNSLLANKIDIEYLSAPLFFKFK